MLKTKYALSALSLLAAMTIATSAWAQNVLSVSSGVQPRAREHGQTELAGGITVRVSTARATGTAADDNTLHSGTLTIDYGVPITNRPGTAAPVSNLQIVGTGCFDLATTGSVNATASYDGSIITIHVGVAAGHNVACTGDSTLDISGVRLQIASQGVSGSMEASIGASGDFRLTSGSNRVAIVNSVVDELTDRGLTTDLNTRVRGNEGVVTLRRHNGQPMLDTGIELNRTRAFVLRIDENAVDSFENADLELEFTGIPEGATLTLDAWVSEGTTAPETDGRVTRSLIGTRAITGIMMNDEVSVVYEPGANGVTAEDNEVVVKMILDEDGNDEADTWETVYDSLSTTADQTTLLGELSGTGEDAEGNTLTGTGEATDPAVDDTIGGALSPIRTNRVTIRGTIAFGRDAEFPLGSEPIQVTVDVGPVGAAFGFAGRIIADPAIRFATDKSSPVTVIAVESDQTRMRVQFAAASATWDTGIAINNSNDADSEQAGPITFEFFSDGESSTYTTMPGSPGSGLDDDGSLGPGGTYAVQLSSLLNAAGEDTNFTGYVDITTDFMGAEGFVFLSSMSGGAWGASGAIDPIVEE